MLDLMYVIAVDVGSESVRSCICQFQGSLGKVLATKKQQITIHNVQQDYYEQDTNEIWTAVSNTIRACIKETNVDTSLIKGIAFTATCSLAIVGETLTSGNNVIMWMDHRSVEVANSITETKDNVLQQFGGVCSPEMSLAKMCWIKKNQADIYEKIQLFLELPCWLTYRCVADHLSRPQDFVHSVCSVTCKWGFDPAADVWPEKIFNKFHLDDWQSKIGLKTANPGKLVGQMSEEACRSVGISESNTKVAVASSIIDAHAGVLAMYTLYASHQNSAICEEEMFDNVLSMISGTSTCIMALSKERRSTSGVWGPYLNVIFEGVHVREAGQSATGKLIDYIIESHPQRQQTPFANLNKNELVHELNDRIAKRDAAYRNRLSLNASFYGNRSPLAMPHLRACVYGLSMEQTSLEDYYEAVVEALAYEVKFIVEELKMNGPKLKLIVSGGLSHNRLYMQTHADVLNCELIAMNTENADMMLVGASVLARQAATGQSVKSLSDIRFENTKFDHYTPNVDKQRYHQVKYSCYRNIVECSVNVCKQLQTL